MSTTRRGFLRMIGLGAAAVAVGPAILKAIPAPKLTAVTKYRSGSELNNYFAQSGRRMQEQILRILAATNPFMELVDGQKRPLPWVAEEDEQMRREVAEYHREERNSQEWWVQQRGWYPSEKAPR